MEESKGPGRANQSASAGDPDQQQVPERGRRGRDEGVEPVEHGAQKRQRRESVDGRHPSSNGSSKLVKEEESGQDIDSSDDGIQHGPVSEDEAERRLTEIYELLEDCKLSDQDYEDEQGKTKGRYDFQRLNELQKQSALLFRKLKPEMEDLKKDAL